MKNFVYVHNVMETIQFIFTCVVSVTLSTTFYPHIGNGKYCKYISVLVNTNLTKHKNHVKYDMMRITRISRHSAQNVG